jgi:hypothetical protein
LTGPGTEFYDLSLADHWEIGFGGATLEGSADKEFERASLAKLACQKKKVLEHLTRDEKAV